MQIAKLIIKTVLDNSEFDDGLDNLNKDSKIKNVIAKIKNKFSSIFSNVKEQAGKVGSTFAKLGGTLVKTLAKATLGAVGFGIAFTTAFAVISAIVLAIITIGKAVERVFETDKQLKTDIQYIIFAIQTALQPVIDAIANVLVKIIRFLVTIFQYAMAIANLIAGKNLFEKATPKAFADSMKDASKSAKSTAKSAKEIKKQLAGFDEMNILGKNTPASGGIGGGGNIGITPSIDFSKITSDVQQVVEKYKSAWDQIHTVTEEQAYRTFINEGSPWGLAKFGVFEIIQGMVFQIESLGGAIGGIGKIVKGVFTGDWKTAGDGAKQIIDNIIKGVWGLGETIRGVFNSITGLGTAAGTFIREKVIQPISDWLQKKIGLKLSEILNLPLTLGRKVAEKITNKITEIKNKFDWLKNKIKENFQDGFWKGIANTLIDIMNKAIDKINSKFELNISSGVAKVLNALGINLSAGKYQIIKMPHIPRLAKGGIVSMPGKGVPIGGALAGERGAEGVIPLTDSQQMELLGEAIGRYITINANITNNMNGRVISRELQKIQNENSFAGNR